MLTVKIQDNLIHKTKNFLKCEFEYLKSLFKAPTFWFYEKKVMYLHYQATSNILNIKVSRKLIIANANNIFAYSSMLQNFHR